MAGIYQNLIVSTIAKLNALKKNLLDPTCVSIWTDKDSLLTGQWIRCLLHEQQSFETSISGGTEARETQPDQHLQRLQQTQ